MHIIKPSDTYSKATWLETDFPALIIDDFLSIQDCEKLIIDGENFIKSQAKINSVIHGGRVMIPFSSNKFKELIKRSEAWNQFSKIFRNKCFKFIMNELNNIKNLSEISKSSIEEFKRTELKKKDTFNILSKFNIGDFEKKYSALLEYKIGLVPPYKLLSISLIRLLDTYFRRLISFKDFLFRKKPLIPLFDYSYSSNGYGREIHRDSDNRLIVVLLYLNDLDQSTSGGDLEIYKMKKEKMKQNIYPPQPNKKDCDLQYVIKPKKGRLIMFVNQFNSYHGVSEMVNDKRGRHFIYGGFTYPSSLFINKKRLLNTKLKTEMFLYK